MITKIIIYEFIWNDLIGVYVKEERLHNPCGFVSIYIIYVNGPDNNCFGIQS